MAKTSQRPVDIRTLPSGTLVHGGPNHCATCRSERKTIAVASDPHDPRRGRWYVCSHCKETAEKHRCGLAYKSIVGS